MQETPQGTSELVDVNEIDNIVNKKIIKNWVCAKLLIVYKQKDAQIASFCTNPCRGGPHEEKEGGGHLDGN